MVDLTWDDGEERDLPDGDGRQRREVITSHTLKQEKEELVGIFSYY